MDNEVSVNTLITKYSIKSIMYKALYSSAVGYPISMGINAALLHWIAWVATSYPYLYASAIIGIPYFIASFSRQFTIDYVYHKTGYIVDPKHLIEVAYYRIKREFT